MRFRHVQRSDQLYSIIIYTLNIIQQPLLQLFGHTSQAVDSLAGDAVQLAPRMETLRLIASIYYSLVYQDLPEYFEDHMDDWMKGFSKYLEYKNPVLVDDDEENAPGPIDKLQTSIIQILKLFAERDEEPFQQFLKQFTSLVWNLLVGLTKYTKHDQLVVTSMKFLSILVGRQIYRDLFNSEETLKQIVAAIIIPNMMVRESDEENFEDNPAEFIMTELEGSDNESRRRCSRDLLKAMCQQFETQATSICSEHITTMITEFVADPTTKWIAKDTAVSRYIITAVALLKSNTYMYLTNTPVLILCVCFFCWFFRFHS
jgi:exportin-2 (importin alpha re-exporter)